MRPEKEIKEAISALDKSIDRYRVTEFPDSGSFTAKDAEYLIRTKTFEKLALKWALGESDYKPM
jgi:hypothetical protein